MSPSGSGVQLRWTETKRKRAPAVSNEQWIQHRDEIIQLHARMKLDDLMLHLKTRYNFCPSKHQIVLQLHKWGCRKYKSKDETNSVTTGTPSSTATTKKTPKQPPIVTDIAAAAIDPIDSFDQWGDLDDFSFPFPTLGDEDNAFDFIPTLPQSNTNDKSQNTLQRSDTVREIEVELDMAFQAFMEQDTMIGHLVTEPETTSPTNEASNVDNEAQYDVVSLLSSRSLKLQRVPRAQKRPKSISSLESAQEPPKRNKTHGYCEHIVEDADTSSSMTEDTDFSPLHGVKTQTSQPSQDQDGGSLGSFDLSQPSLTPDEDSSSVSGTDSPVASLTTSAQDEPSDFAIDLLTSSGSTPLTRLLTLARKGQVIRNEDDVNTERISKMAWFFFGAGLYEEAFILHLMVYKTLQTLPTVDTSTLFSSLINLTRCSTSEAQNCIVKELLLKTCRKRHTGHEGDPLENFLLHSFLTRVWRRQNNLTKADHHCHRAIQWYQQAQHAKSACNRWLSLSVVAWTLLRSNITENRLQIRATKISNSVRRNICAKASDQLIMRLWSSQISDGTRHALDNLVTHKADRQCVSLRTLFEWCLQVIENHPSDLDNQQLWRKTRAAGMKLRTLGMTALYCQLWRAWHQEAAERSLTYTVSDYWSSTIEDELGINPSECLATIPDAIAIKWPYMDEDIPTLANWRTYHQELQKRVIASLKSLLDLSDVHLAHHFFRSYSAHCIAPTKSDVDSIGFSAMHKECVISFANANLDFLLPSMTLQEHVSDSKNSQSTFVACQQTDNTQSTVADDTIARSSTGRSERPLSIEDPALNRRAYRNSMRSADSMSVDLASMKSIQRRVAERRLMRHASDADSGPSSCRIRELDAMSIDGLVDLTRRSMRSMSLHETFDTVDAESLMRLLSDSIAQQDVKVY